MTTIASHKSGSLTIFAEPSWPGEGTSCCMGIVEGGSVKAVPHQLPQKERGGKPKT